MRTTTAVNLSSTVTIENGLESVLEVSAKSCDVGGCLQIEDERSVVLDHASARPDGPELREEQVELCGQAFVGVLDPGALCSGDQGLVEIGVRGGDLAPIGSLRPAGANKRVETIVHAARQRPVVSIEGQAARFELESRPELEEGDEIRGCERRDGGAAGGDEPDQAFAGESAECGAESVRRDVVHGRECFFSKCLAGGELAGEDACTESVRERVDDGRAWKCRQLVCRAHAGTRSRLGSARTPMPAMTSSRPTM